MIEYNKIDTLYKRDMEGTKKLLEGLVGRPKVEMRDRCGKRVIVKIKWEDFK